MKSITEIDKKLTELKETEEGIINSTEPVTNEIKVILVGSQLQQAVIKHTMNMEESEVEAMLEKETKKLKSIKIKFLRLNSNDDDDDNRN